MCEEIKLIDLVSDLLSLNDDNLMERVISSNDVQWCLSELSDILEAEEADTEVFQTAIKKYGAEAQTLMVFEEMSELQKELCKHARGADNVYHIAEEIADVQIMLEQMIVLHHCKTAVDYYKGVKIDRLSKRLTHDV